MGIILLFAYLVVHNHKQNSSRRPSRTGQKLQLV